MQVKKTWKQVDGVLLLDKSLGMTSNDALQKARRLFSAAKGGHTGTLDPLATGLLPLCFGEATKFSADLLDADKTYETTLQLGVTTDSGDAEGVVTNKSPVNISKEQILEVIQQFEGNIAQVPPMHSALKKDGRPLYELARQGIEVEREARAITIHRIELLGVNGTQIDLRIRCSKGTYIRVLGADIGQSLGCGAHLANLRRTSVGHLTLENALSLEQLQDMIEENRLTHLQPVDSLLSTLDAIFLDSDETDRFLHGNPVRAGGNSSVQMRVYREKQLLGLGEWGKGGMLWPKRLVKQATSLI